jgi:NAD(P)H-nitrite reductase large subunit
MRIGIIGAGHAGVEAARVARAAGADVVLYSAEAVTPYYRPRLVALAFGHAEVEGISLHPPEWYAAQGIDLRLSTPVESYRAETREVVVGGRTEAFDGLIVTNGALPVVPPFARTGGQAIWPLWNVDHAREIRKRVRPGARLAIVGGGILGIEAALRGLEAGMTVTIIELLDRLMPAQFGARASEVLLRRLRARGIHVRLGHGVKATTGDGTMAHLTLGDGHSLEAELCLVSIGARPDTRSATTGGLETDRGVIVNPVLQTRHAACFAAGDVIQFDGVTRCSMKEATSQGRIAGLNVVAALQGRELQSYLPETMLLSFRAKDFEIYSLGQPGGVGCEEHLLDGMTESVIRALIMKDGIPLGVQMIGTREGFDGYAAAVKHGKKA